MEAQLHRERDVVVQSGVEVARGNEVVTRTLQAEMTAWVQMLTEKGSNIVDRAPKQLNISSPTELLFPMLMIAASFGGEQLNGEVRTFRMWLVHTIGALHVMTSNPAVPPSGTAPSGSKDAGGIPLSTIAQHHHQIS